MSWSIAVIGRPTAVLAKVKMDLEKQKCAEPEESVKNAFIAAVTAAISGFTEDMVVTVSGNGSQYKPDANNPVKIINSFNMKLDPTYAFVE